MSRVSNDDMDKRQGLRTAVGTWLQRLTWHQRLFVGYAVVLGVLAAVWAFSLAGPVNQAMEDRQREGLVSVAHATRVALNTSTETVQTILNTIATDDDLRFTLISSNGTVIADSNGQASPDNHATRPEVLQALSGATGFDRRVSETDGVEYLYVAIPCNTPDDGAVLRVSMPVTQAHTALAQFRLTSIALLLAALLLSIALAWFSSSRTAQPLHKLERVRSDFVANASHALKTPVAGIRLLSESLTQASQAHDMDTVQHFSERLQQEAIRLQKLVTDLISLSRLENNSTGKSDITSTLSVDDLAALICASVDAHQVFAQVKGLVLSFTHECAHENTKNDHMDTGLHKPMPKDQLGVAMNRQDASAIIDNLLDNALGYTTSGTVTVKLHRDEESLILTVHDTGIGIPHAEQERIFERFYRVERRDGDLTEGSGLGLALVRHAVERAGGTISVESKPEQGSRFTVALPLVIKLHN